MLLPTRGDQWHDHDDFSRMSRDTERNQPSGLFASNPVCSTYGYDRWCQPLLFLTFWCTHVNSGNTADMAVWLCAITYTDLPQRAGQLKLMFASTFVRDWATFLKIQYVGPIDRLFSLGAKVVVLSFGLPLSVCNLCFASCHWIYVLCKGVAWICE